MPGCLGVALTRHFPHRKCHALQGKWVWNGREIALQYRTLRLQKSWVKVQIRWSGRCFQKRGYEHRNMFLGPLKWVGNLVITNTCVPYRFGVTSSKVKVTYTLTRGSQGQGDKGSLSPIMWSRSENDHLLILGTVMSNPKCYQSN